MAELDPPQGGRTYWDFSLLDPILEDFMRATAGHPVIMNISTIPEWMFKTVRSVSYPADPDEITWDYEQGTELRDPSRKEVADYFARLASWYLKGGFKDEFGRLHESGHHFQVAYWEVLNEADIEHKMTPQYYTSIYDGIGAAVRQVEPEMKFAGMALASPMTNPEFFHYFLNPKNHKPGTPLDAITYHFYADATPDEDPEMMQHAFFARADGFLDVVGYIESIRKRLSPSTQTFVNEIGTILPAPHQPKLLKPIPDSYWNLSGALFAYVYARLARMGIDMAHESELIDYPGQCAGTNLVDWETGRPTARYWVLKLLCDHLGLGDKLVDTPVSATSPDLGPTAYVYAQGFVKKDAKRKILLINKRDRSFEVAIPGGAGASIEVVDQTTSFNPPARHQLEADKLTLPGFAVAVVTLAN